VFEKEGSLSVIHDLCSHTVNVFVVTAVI